MFSDSDMSSMKRMMGITPSLLELVSGRNLALYEATLDVQVLRSKKNDDYVKIKVSGAIGKTPFRGESLPVATSIYTGKGGGRHTLESAVHDALSNRIFKQKNGDWDYGRGSEIPMALLKKVVKEVLAKLKK